MGGKKDFFLGSAEMEITCPEKEVFITAGWLKIFKQNIMEKKICNVAICIYPPPQIVQRRGESSQTALMRHKGYPWHLSIL